jgi:membrane-associated protease RseP (regulator of RpoE activity)
MRIVGGAMKIRKDYLGAAGIALLTIGILAILYVTNAVGVPGRVAIAIFVVLPASGIMIRKVMGLSGGYGLYLIGGKRGLRTIDSVSKKHRKFWDAMAMWGLSMGFGLLAYPLVKGKIDKRIWVLGILSSIFVMLFVQQYFSVALQFISLPQIQGTVSSNASALQQNASLLAYMVTAVTLVSGFSGYIFVLLLANAASILVGIAQLLLSYLSGAVNFSTVKNQIPGVAPIIPGWDVPLLAGVTSLAILLIVHEFSHGVLSRIAKVKLKSTGLLMFGIVPVGGYVEPDERMVKKLDSAKQTRLFSAGIAANFIAMFVFFALLVLIMNYVAPYAYHYGIVVTGTTQGYPANGILEKGMQVLQWNGQKVTGISDLTAAAAQDRPNSTISVVTGSGTFVFRAVPEPGNSTRGVIGVELGYQPVINTWYAKAVYFAYTLVALSMVLNFFVAVVNLLPVPGFDGWRIYKANIKSDKLIRFLAALILAGIAINILQWVFYI